MDSPVEEDHQICGIVILKDSNAFVYRCRKCDCEFATGCGFEVHFLYEHMDKTDDLTNSDLYSIADDDVSVEIVELDSSFEENTEGDEADIDEISSDSFEVPAKRRRTQKQNVSAGVAGDTAKVFYCDMCSGESFSSLRSLREHMECHLTNKAPGQSEICDEHSINYEKNLEGVHDIENPYEIDGQRLVHERKHTNAPQSFKHQCNECERAFRTPGELQQHTNSIHSFIRPFACHFCGKHLFL